MTFTATKNDAGAGVAYLDSIGNVIDDADTTAEGHQVDLEVGDNVITVLVTAEDGTTQDYLVTVTRDDAAALPTLSVADASGAESAGVMFTVTLSETATAEVTATWTASIESVDTAADADLGSTRTGTVTVAVNGTMGTFTVSVALDTTDEDNQSFTVTLSNPSNATLAADPTATGTIEDDDDPPTISVQDQTVNEGDQNPDLIEGGVPRLPVPGDAVGGEREAGAVQDPAGGTAQRHGDGCGPEAECGPVSEF